MFREINICGENIAFWNDNGEMVEYDLIHYSVP